MPNFAPPPVLGVLYINDIGDNEGWTESYWIDDSDLESAWNRLYNRIWKTRRSLLTVEYKLVYARTSKTNVRGDSFSQPLPIDFKDTWNQVTSLEGAAGAPNNLALMLKYHSSAALVRGIHPLHGIPSELVGHEGGDAFADSRAFHPNPVWDAVFAKYEVAVKATCSNLHVLARGAAPATTILKGAISASTMELTVDSAKLFPKEGKFRFKIDGEEMQFLKHQQEMRDGELVDIATKWVVLRGQNSTTAVTHADTAAVVAIQGDLVQAEAISFITVPTRLRYRKVGRPFGLLKGRTVRKPCVCPDVSEA